MQDYSWIPGRSGAAGADMAGSYLSDCCTAQRQRKNGVDPGAIYGTMRIRLDSIRITQPPRSIN